MTIDKRETINIPKFWFVLILPLLIGGIGGYATSRASNARQEEKVLNLEKTVEKKANQAEFEMVCIQLNRIEEKLDKRMEK